MTQQQNTHHTKPGNELYVTGSDWYRVVGALPLTPDREDFTELESVFLPEFRRPDGYGLVFLESEEHTRMWLGDVEHARAVLACEVQFDVRQGITSDGWPNQGAWKKVTPKGTWHPEGYGILTVHPHPVTSGAEVIVYEFEGAWLRDKPAVPMVTYHCTACHKDTFHDSGHVHESTEAHARRWAGRQARSHMRSAAKHGVSRDGSSECRPVDPRMLKAVNEVARKNLGPGHIPHPEDGAAYCAINGPCSVLRELRAGVRPAPYGTGR